METIKVISDSIFAVWAQGLILLVVGAFTWLLIRPVIEKAIRLIRNYKNKGVE